MTPKIRLLIFLCFELLDFLFKTIFAQIIPDVQINNPTYFILF